MGSVAGSISSRNKLNLTTKNLVMLQNTLRITRKKKNKKTGKKIPQLPNKIHHCTVIQSSNRGKTLQRSLWFHLCFLKVFWAFWVLFICQNSREERKCPQMWIWETGKQAENKELNAWSWLKQHLPKHGYNIVISEVKHTTACLASKRALWWMERCEFAEIFFFLRN